MALLELRGISKRFGGLQALNRVDLTVEDGMIAALIGPNGAGKTTLFHTLTGIYRPDEGEIRFIGRSLVGLKPDKITGAGISRTFQNIRLFARMTVLENILVGMHCRISTGLCGDSAPEPRGPPPGKRCRAQGDGVGRACRAPRQRK